MKSYVGTGINFLTLQHPTIKVPVEHYAEFVLIWSEVQYRFGKHPDTGNETLLKGKQLDELRLYVPREALRDLADQLNKYADSLDELYLSQPIDELRLVTASPGWAEAAKSADSDEAAASDEAAG